MPKNKNTDLTKVTLNLRTGDLAKMRELFPNEAPSVSVRLLLSGFVDKYYVETATSTVENIDLTTL